MTSGMYCSVQLGIYNYNFWIKMIGQDRHIHILATCIAILFNFYRAQSIIYFIKGRSLSILDGERLAIKEILK